MANKKPIPETTSAETVVAEAEALAAQITEAETELEARREALKEQREFVATLYVQLKGLFADEQRPLLAMSEEAGE